MASENGKICGVGNRYGLIGKVKRVDCPCGKGFIETEVEDIPGHRYRVTTICCDRCVKEYKIVDSQSVNWRIEKK